MGIFSTSFVKMTCKRVDCAIQHTGLSLIKKERFCYFINKHGDWTGDVFPVSVMDEYGLREWIELAERIIDRSNDYKKNKQSYQKV